MLKQDVRVGDVVAVKVSGRVSPVQVTGISPRYRGRQDRFTGRNLATGREVGSFTAAKARRKLCGVVESGQICSSRPHAEGSTHIWEPVR